jgi:methyltransferase (TIGR00027 family)
VALLRAELDRPHTTGGDPDAQRALCMAMRPLRSLQLWHQIAARTRFFDEQVLVAISAGVRQVVICGAGYDDRALRFRSPGVRFFELDLPDTQTDKADQLRAMGADTVGLTLAAADFRTDDVATVLGGCGHDAKERSLFICEGLLAYLDQSTCTRLLAGLRSQAAPASTLAAGLSVHSSGGDSDQLTAAANARRRAGQAEPWRTILPLDAHLALLDRAGWQVEHMTDPVELDAAAAPGRTQLVTAVAGHGG